MNISVCRVGRDWRRRRKKSSVALCVCCYFKKFWMTLILKLVAFIDFKVWNRWYSISCIQFLWKLTTEWHQNKVVIVATENNRWDPTNQNALLCDLCELWFHIGCQGIDQTEYNLYQQEEHKARWFCMGCSSIYKDLKKANEKMKEENKRMKDENEDLKKVIE